MSDGLAIGAGDVTKIGVGVIVALVVVGFLLSLIITAILGRLLLIAVVVVLAVLVWQQRTHIEDSVNAHTCELNATFFGVHLAAPDAVRQACRTST